jgi:hypothetical protein
LKALYVALALSLATFAPGCSGDDGEQQSAATTRSGATPSGTTQSRTTPSGVTTRSGRTTSPNASVPAGSTSGEPAAPQRKATRTATPKERRVNRYLRRHFSSGVSPSDAWYSHVDGVTVAGTTTTIETDLSPGTSLAKQICISVRGAIPGLTDSVRVKGATGKTLASCVP